MLFSFKIKGEKGIIVLKITKLLKTKKTFNPMAKRVTLEGSILWEQTFRINANFNS